MTDHEQELPARDPRNALAELDYWRPILDDLRAMNDAVMSAADHLVNVPVTLLELVLAPTTSDGFERVGGDVRAAMSDLRTLSERLEALGDLAEGRMLAITREMGLGS